MAGLAVSCTMLSPLGHVRVNEDTPRVLEGPQDQPGFENAYQNFIDVPLSKLILMLWKPSWSRGSILSFYAEGCKFDPWLWQEFFAVFSLAKAFAQKYILPFSVRLSDLTDSFFRQERSFR